ncbi:MAG TPA: SRPBCC family protein [Candidatus Dormibacteraeota bacterium]
MEIENTFPVNAAPDRVYEYLLDINRVVGCVPGAQLSEVVDPTTFRGKVKIKVGPVTVSYDGTARIVSRDDAARSAAIEAEGQETSGSGSARAKVHMSVAPEGEGSLVHFATDFTVVGRVAQFGRGIMEDVSKRLVAQMATCIRQRLEAAGEEAAGASAEAGDTPGSTINGATPAARVAVGAEPELEPAPLDALALAREMAADRLRRRETLIVAGVLALLVMLLLGRRLRR